MLSRRARNTAVTVTVLTRWMPFLSPNQQRQSTESLSRQTSLHHKSLTILAVLVSARPSVVICSFHEPEQLGSVGGAFSSQLQLSGTHCCFTFAPRPSVTVSFKQGSRLIFQAGLSLTFPLRTIEETELN